MLLSRYSILSWMKSYQDPLLSWLLLMVWLQATAGFNLEPESIKHFSDPTRDGYYWGRDSYFGFSVSLQQNNNDNSSWLVVGAPRANSSFTGYNPVNITEPGAIFKCNLQDDQTCEELLIDQTGDTYHDKPFRYQDQKSKGWLGATLDSQPTYKQGRQATATCAPRWMNKVYIEPYMNGACYWLNASLPNAPANKLLPLIKSDQTTKEINGVTYFYYAYGQAGTSLHFPNDPKEMIMGAPGIFQWQGSVIRMKDADDGESMFSDVQLFNPKKTPEIDSFSLNGYAVSSGYFFKSDELLYVSGAPRAYASYGKVFIFDFPAKEEDKLDIRAILLGTQQGESFGASLVSADVNGDGLSDLVVGCPTFFKGSKTDMGRIQVFLAKQNVIGEPVGFHSGSESPSARFGTTLAFLGDLNRDGCEDVAVGAPWEDDGKGAVYIYLGSFASGLRKEYTQRFSPENFPSRNLRGFGMGISRGIDIDGNGYPDLGIGSFLSGDVIVLQSRSVASLKGQLHSDPSALQGGATGFKLTACIEYVGYNVPSEADIYGTIYLDTAYPSMRTSFNDTGKAIMVINATFVKGNTTLSYDIDVENSKLDPRRPIVVILELSLVDNPGQRMSLAVTDPIGPSNFTLPIGLVTGCEDDGDQTCLTNTSVIASFLNYGEDQRFPIGSQDRPVLEITVRNSGEPMFLSNVTIEVPKPFALFMPTSHSCDFQGRERALLVCRLVNPIKRGQEDTVKVTIDSGDVMENMNASEVEVNVVVSGEGEEVQPLDNKVSQKLLLMAKAELKLHGYSVDEQVFYQRIGKDAINSSTPRLSFTHHYTVVKSGPTPLGNVELVVDIPVNFTSDVSFITLHGLSTNFRGQQYSCNLEGASMYVWNANETLLAPTITRKDESLSGSIKSFTSPDDSSVHEKLDFTCAGSSQVSCARLRCMISSWPEGSHKAEFSIKMDVKLPVLASYISAQVGAAIHSTATASILFINPDFPFQGTRYATGATHTDILPDSMASRGIPWWIILLAILLSLLLLTLLIFAMYKAGFFVRKEREEMEAHRARVVYGNNEEAVL